MRENIIDVTQYDIVDDKIPPAFDGYNIVQVSDLHNHLFGADQSELVDRIRALVPDVVLLTGDVVYKRSREMDNALLFIRQVTGFAPVYFVSGNHDWKAGFYDELNSAMRELGVIVLDNRFEPVCRGDERIYLLGLDDRQRYAIKHWNKGYNEFKMSLAELMAKVPSDGYKVMLCHRPEMFPFISAYGVNLVFAGHAHGGQIRFAHVPGIFAPGQGIFPKYTAGIYKKGTSRMVISRGLGNNTIVPRINNHPELVAVRLMNSQFIKASPYMRRKAPYADEIL